MNKPVLFIIDDNIPKSKELIEKNAFESAIDQGQLLKLSQENDWKSEKNLQHIISLLSIQAISEKHSIEIYGFLHPEIAIQAIENGNKPDVIIYDWEYGSSMFNEQSGELLLELLNTTDAFVFVYSGIKGEIPHTLNKKIFDRYANRFQLFGKGDRDSSIFSSEEFIYQYIVSRINTSNSIKIHDRDILFQANGYLSNPTDILYLESILGRRLLLEKLNSISEISEETIGNIVGSVPGEVLLDESSNFLISPNEELLVKRFSPKRHLSYLEVLNKYGIKNLETVLSDGIVKV